MKFRKKMVVVDAERFDPSFRPLPFSAEGVCRFDGAGWFIETLEGRMTLTPGDWVIRGVAGEFYPCKPAIFSAVYEPEQER